MSLMRLVTYVAFHRGNLPFFDAMAAFGLGLRYDARVVAAILLPILIVGSLPYLNPLKYPIMRKVWLTLLGLVSAGLVVVYIVDFIHYRYLGQRLSATALGFLDDAGISSRMVWQSYPVVRLSLAAMVVTGVMVWGARRLLLRVAAGAEVPGKAVRITSFVVVLLGLAVLVFGRLGQYPLRWSDAFRLRGEAGAQLALNPIESFNSSLVFRDTGCDPEKVREHYALMAGYFGVESLDAANLKFDRSVRARADVVASRPNVVLVICESFSAYKSSLWGNPLDTTPFFKELAAQGVFFDNCYTPHFGTARGVWATVTGTPDVSPVETASRNPAMVGQHTIIDDFEGYEKFYFIGGSSSWANIRGVLMNNIRGLRLYEEDSYSSPRVDVWGISDKNLFLEADRVLQKQTKPFFAIIQTAGNHRPYSIPEEDLGEFKRIEVPDEMVRRCGFETLPELNAFRYADFTMQKFIEAARKSPYYENTVFVFIGDHGIGGVAEMLPPAWTKQHLTRFHVPLLFYAPRLLTPQRVHSVASMVDVLPTIAGIVGIGYSHRTFGRDLLLCQKTDGGASNIAFVIDHNDKTIGVINQSYYGLRYPDGRREVVWADFAAPQPSAEVPAGLQREYGVHTDAFYETARYLLLNNKSTPPKAGDTP